MSTRTNLSSCSRLFVLIGFLCGFAAGAFETLESMTNDELEAICISRGFELLREAGANYTREDLIEAAAECLQTEADLEEILRNNPSILQSLQRESSRMKDERTRRQRLEVADDEQIFESEEASIGADALTKGDADASQEGTGKRLDADDDSLSFGVREIAREVLAQMKSDVERVIMFILPKPLRESLQSSLKPLVSVLNNWRKEAFDMIRRYMRAFGDSD
ncbi:hypothetical protein THAOC_00129 [Thalassiosira oceanica]|uniref:Uncharacterized protein n=1 Tax=Thalassiosira oceanica TaxID=159749 RepID=K0TPJ5_THAOC|nr:hypothetical protein THAOC_00129 [Thalassiosira oceanica]|eukprot:EJK77996.1 hypothetical protein THAOC_00129 [Thalassiosira oceanica]